MPYKFDVFLSYANEFPFNNWTRQRLLPLLETYFANELSRPPKIFFDRDNLAPGDAWPESLKNALAHSRCMVSIWSPSYFRSKWCTAECAVMLNREKRLGLRTIRKPKGLVLPITIYDGERFPKYAKDIQQLKCQQYARDGDGFTRSERYLEFQDVLIEWAVHASETIRQAPRWSKKWLQPEWLDDPIQEYDHSISAQFDPPFLE